MPHEIKRAQHQYRKEECGSRIKPPGFLFSALLVRTTDCLSVYLGKVEMGCPENGERDKQEVDDRYDQWNAEAEQMVETCDKSGVKLGVSFPERYHPAHIEARRFAKSGDAGNIEVVHAQFCRGGSSPIQWRNWRSDLSISGAGALYAAALHPIDLLRFLLDSEIKEVRALTDENPPESPLESMVYAIFKYENGTHGIVMTGALAPRSETSVVLYGSKAKITLRETIWGPKTDNLGELLIDGDSDNLRKDFPTDNPLSLRMTGEIEAYNRWIRDGIEPHISGRNGLQMVKIANAILESSRQGKAVKI